MNAIGKVVEEIRAAQQELALAADADTECVMLSRLIRLAEKLNTVVHQEMRRPSRFES